MKRKHSDVSSDDLKNLHTRGFVVINSVFSMEKDLLDDIRKSTLKYHTIFNQKGSNDRKRRQSVFRPSTRRVKRWYMNLTTVLKKLTPTDPVVIVSNDGCAKQRPHMDYVKESIRDVSDDLMPCGVIICLQPMTKLLVWEKSIKMEHEKDGDKISPLTVIMQPGDVCVFRGDLVHAGADYDTENTRMHLYMDSPAVKRDKNRTCHIDSVRIES